MRSEGFAFAWESSTVPVSLTFAQVSILAELYLVYLLLSACPISFHLPLINFLIKYIIHPITWELHVYFSIVSYTVFHFLFHNCAQKPILSFLYFPTTLLTLTSYYCVWIQRPVLKPASKGAQISNRHNCLALKLDKQTNKTPKQTQPINISLTNFNIPKKGYIKK